MEDWIAWHFDSKGFFLVKSAYRPGASLRDKDQQRDVGTSSAVTEISPLWKSIWALKLPSKVKNR
jgi:hypothetical protein